MRLTRMKSCLRIVATMFLSQKLIFAAKDPLYLSYYCFLRFAILRQRVEDRWMRMIQCRATLLCDAVFLGFICVSRRMEI